MKHLTDLKKTKEHLLIRYKKLIERSNDYKYVDESISDIACFKAIKILDKLNRIKFLENSFV